MNEFWVVMSHTYWSKFKTKSFLLTSILSIIFIIIISNAPTIIEKLSNGENEEIAVIDESEELLNPLREKLDNADADIKLITFSGSESEAKKSVKNEDYYAFIKLELDANELPKATYYANNITGIENQEIIKEQVQHLKDSVAIQQADINKEYQDLIYSSVEFDTVALDQGAKTNEELDQARGIVYIMLFLLYITVLIYGQMIATDVATEKSSRVMEILISSISPMKQMFAKIFGVALLGITQLVIIIGLGYITISLKKNELTGGLFSYFGLEGASISLFIYAILFFLLGYLLYAMIAATLGSLVSKIEDVQQLTMPMVLLIIVAFMISILGLSMPDAKFVTISSFIPFFSPMIMFLRVGMLDVPFWEIALSMVLLVISIVFLGILGARVYKGGVLMYGKSGSLKDFKKALKLSGNK